MSCIREEPREAGSRRAWPRTVLGLSLVAGAMLMAPAPAFAQEAGDGSTTDPEAGDGTTATAEPKLSLSASARRVRLGEKVTFSGRRQPARADKVVKLEYRRPGGRYKTVARDTTNDRGRYRVALTPRRNGRYRAVSTLASGERVRSSRVTVDVNARITINARRHQLRSRGVKVRGRVRPDAGRRDVVVQRRTSSGWNRIATTRTDRDGRYRVRWSPRRLGSYRFRARFPGDALNRRDVDKLAHRVTVYRSDHASYYGPGFYGNRTACGQVLRRDTVGVAHKRLPCGTRVRFHYRGRTRTVPVIDRGPYIAGRRWDLTNAARRKLGFPRGTGTIWANR